MVTSYPSGYNQCLCSAQFCVPADIHVAFLAPSASSCLTRVHTQVLSVSRGVWPHPWPHWLLQAAHPPGFLSGVVKAPPNTQCEFIYFQRLPGTGELHCSSKDNRLILTIRLRLQEEPCSVTQQYLIFGGGKGSCHGIAGITALVQPIQVMVVTPCFDEQIPLILLSFSSMEIGF